MRAVHFALALAVWAMVATTPAQTPPSLRLQFSDAQASISITGKVGAIYSIQSATNLSPTNDWMDRTLVQAAGGRAIWLDPSDATLGQRYYRAVSIPVPADTNLVFIPTGTFTMGSLTNEAEHSDNETQHTVTISRGFWMEKFLVTQADYLAVLGTNPSFFNGFQTGYPAPPGGMDYGTNLARPVETVTWFDASNYCALRTQRERAAGLIPTNCSYRLPTESEWEYACRAGTTTAFYLGSALYSGQANFDGTNEYDAAIGDIYDPTGVYLQTTTAVGTYAPNGWGLYDMIGNVFEWCQDWYDAYPPGPVTDPQGPAMGQLRVFRGGSWGNFGVSCRSGHRVDLPPGGGYNIIGFRVVLSLDQL